MSDSLRPGGETSPEPVPLPYARPVSPPPLDQGNTVRQLAFSVGVGVACGSLVYAFADSYRGDASPWVGIGMCLIALTLPFPGRIGRRRE
jgi:hypothetical protein